MHNMKYRIHIHATPSDNGQDVPTWVHVQAVMRTICEHEQSFAYSPDLVSYHETGLPEAIVDIAPTTATMVSIVHDNTTVTLKASQ